MIKRVTVYPGAAARSSHLRVRQTGVSPGAAARAASATAPSRRGRGGGGPLDGAELWGTRAA